MNERPSHHRPRPYVVAVSALTLDGRLRAADRNGPSFPSPADQRFLLRERARADAVLVGGETVRRENPSLSLPLRLRKERARSGRAVLPWVCVVTRRCDFPEKSRCLRAPARRIVLTGESAPQGRVRMLEKLGVEVVRIGKREVDFRRAFSWLARQKAGRIQCEGGGSLLYPLLEKKLIDEIALTLCPYVSGAEEAPSLADGPGFGQRAMPNFSLVGVARLGDEVFLRYRKK